MSTQDQIAIVEFANDAFYTAFNASDIEMMSSLWLNAGNVVCIHPGWPPLIGFENVIASWENIFNGGATQLNCHPYTVVPQGQVYSVLCYEELQGGWLIATNNFMLTDSGPRLIHHQASPCPAPDMEELTPTASPQ